VTAVSSEQAAKPNTREQLAPVHDFAAKLLQPSVLPRLKQYVRWQSEIRRRINANQPIQDILDRVDDVPVSVNLDLTTACNYKCDHCVDLEILNTGIRYDHDKLKESLRLLAERGLKTVIVIGGGEPTVYPGFGEVMRFMKGLGLALGVVSNGSGNAKILEIADCLDERDWVRYSLDSGTEHTFQVMHKPRKPITLDEICEGVGPIRDANPKVPVGFSYIITWKGAEGNGMQIHENIGEMVMAAERARRYRFSYISFKPFLTRAAANHAEIVDFDDPDAAEARAVIDTIRRSVDEAKKLETPDFRVVESTNLRVLEAGTAKNYQNQPRNCHMQWFRQVISPLGLYNCPVYRNQPHGQVSHKHGYSDAEEIKTAQRNTLKLIATFNATEQCKEVTCLYNHVNWFIEDLVEHPEKLEALHAGTERNDYFL
jgi:MoaA/NifB/PqqE/SkfB family radical SAM enzyme